MEFLDCIKGRRSIRRFKTDSIDHEIMNRIVEAASFSPSWKNTQIARYILVEDKDKINYIADNCMCGFEYNSNTLKSSPAIVLLTIIKGRSGFERDGSFSTPKGDRWEMFDAGIAAQSFCLSAYNEGLGTVILGIFDEDKISSFIDIPDGQQLATVVAIGYPNETPDAPKRKSADELLDIL